MSDMNNTNVKQSKIRKVSNGEIVDLKKYNKRALRRLHYEEERIMAQRICALPPFSKARFKNMRIMYQFANAVMPWYLPEAELSYGANDSSVEVVCEFLRADNKEKLIYEAGVGVGFSCRRFVEIPGVKVKGCDVVVTEQVKTLMKQFKNLSVDETTVYNSLKKLDDNSIDYFYADNVIEHLLPDEFPKILRLLSRKMKRNGILFLIIPNRLIGPCDVSLYFKNKGEKAEGSHFMEMSYRETLAKFSKVGIVPQYLTWRNKDNFIYIKDRFGIMNRIKVGIELIMHWLMKWTRMDGEKVFYKSAMTYYILVNKRIV